jgi:hypothetical protein
VSDPNEETFVRLTQEFISKMGGVKCSKSSYRGWLQYAIGELQVEISASRELDDDEDSLG